MGGRAVDQEQRQDREGLRRAVVASLARLLGVVSRDSCVGRQHSANDHRHEGWEPQSAPVDAEPHCAGELPAPREGSLPGRRARSEVTAPYEAASGRAGKFESQDSWFSGVPPSAVLARVTGFDACWTIASEGVSESPV